MSDHGHGGSAHLKANDYGVRPSAGISWMLYVFIVVSLIVIFWQGSNVVRSAGSGRISPAADSAKVPLPPSHI
jgi:hypothetical protein